MGADHDRVKLSLLARGYAICVYIAFMLLVFLISFAVFSQLYSEMFSTSFSDPVLAPNYEVLVLPTASLDCSVQPPTNRLQFCVTLWDGAGNRATTGPGWGFVNGMTSICVDKSATPLERIYAAVGIHVERITRWELTCTNGGTTCRDFTKPAYNNDGSDNCEEYEAVLRAAASNLNNYAQSFDGAFSVTKVNAEDGDLWGQMCGFCTYRIYYIFAIYSMLLLGGLIVITDGVFYIYNRMNDNTGPTAWSKWYFDLRGVFTDTYPWKWLCEVPVFGSAVWIILAFVHNPAFQMFITAFFTFQDGLSVQVATSSIEVDSARLEAVSGIIEFLLVFLAVVHFHTMADEDAKSDAEYTLPVPLFLLSVVSFSVTLAAVILQFVTVFQDDPPLKQIVTGMRTYFTVTQAFEIIMWGVGKCNARRRIGGSDA